MGRLAWYKYDTATCCGVMEIGDFYIEDDYDDRKPTVSECKQAFAEMQDQLAKGYYYTAWFVRPKKFDGTFERQYEAAHLATLISKLPGCVKIKPIVNPNSGNMIKGYVWKQQ